MKFVFAVAVLALFRSCDPAPATVDGECKAFHDPGFAVQGKRLQDKQWIGKTQETGIQVCGWKRPAK